MSIPNLPSIPVGRLVNIPSTFLSLQDLIKAEELDATKPKLGNKVDWFRDVFRILGSAVPNVWRPVSIITIWATTVAVADFLYEQEWHVTNNVIPLLSVVVGLMLVFRNTAAYSRWDEGRKSFTSLVSTTRTLSRYMWVSIGARVPETRVDSRGKRVPHVTHHNDEDDDEAGDGVPGEEHRRKIRAIRLLVAFVFATKRHVRGEYGCDFDDLRTLLPRGFYDGTPGYGYGSLEADRDRTRARDSYQGPNILTPTVEESESKNGMESNGVSIPTPTDPTLLSSPPASAATRSSQSASPGGRRRLQLGNLVQSQRDEFDEESPLLPPGSAPPPLSPPPSTKKRARWARAKSPLRHDEERQIAVHQYLSKPSLPLPLIIAHQLHLYLARCKAHGLLESIGPAGHNFLASGLSSMTDQFTQIEKLTLFTMPSCYAIHMKQATTLYLLALPLTLRELSWMLIPFVTLVAFTLMGIEAMARMCEDPFGTDAADLPLDMVSAELRNEVEHLIARLPTSTSELLI